MQKKLHCHSKTIKLNGVANKELLITALNLGSPTGLPIQIWETFMQQWLKGNHLEMRTEDMGNDAIIHRIWKHCECMCVSA